MHNIDRTNPEISGETMETMETMESMESMESQEAAFEWEVHGMGEVGEAQELNETMETPELLESPFNETQEMELASELLEITNEEELNYFLGNLIKKAGSVLGKVVRSPVGQALGGVLKKVAKTALPMAGAALGNLVLPGVGGMIGGKLASAAGSMFGLELEGMSGEDREFEVARRFVRLAGATTRRALVAPPRTNPVVAVRTALRSAARRHAPGLPAVLFRPRPRFRAPGFVAPAYAPGYVPTNGGFAPAAAPAASYAPDGMPYAAPVAPGYPEGYGRTGRWFRRGRRIVLLGV